MSDEQKQVAKRARLDMGNSAAGPVQIQNATAADQMSSPILKLDIDCFEELFEWLPLADLRALRQTCKRLKQVVDYFIKENYPAAKIGFGRIRLYDWDFHKIKELDPIKVKMIRDVEICVDELTEQTIDTLKETLPQLERLTFPVGALQSNSYESIIKRCSNLKYLSIGPTTLSNESPDEWNDDQKFQHFMPFSVNVRSVNFLQLNPNIQTFSCGCEILDFFYDLFLESNIKINLLNVYVGYDREVDNTCRKLDQLYEHGFHKRLHLFVYSVKHQTQLDRIALLRGLEKFHLYRFRDTQHTLPAMPCLRELCIGDPSRLSNLELISVSKIFLNLERVYFRESRTVDIIQLIQFAPQVREIKVDYLEEGVHFENGIIDLLALNKWRKGLPGAKKVTIYVKEKIFLRTKFATKKTEYSLVILKRAQAVEWTHEFSVYYE